MFRDDCEELAYEIAFWTIGLQDPDYPLDELGELARELCFNLRSIGIMLLLSEGHPDKLHHNLIRSARARLTYLMRVRSARALEDHEYVSSITEPVLDAIAAGDLTLARELLRLAPSAFRPGHEYEDDYCYAQVLARLLDGQGLEPEIAALLSRKEAYLGNDSDARLAVCRALASSDAAAFAETFALFLAARGDQIEAEKEHELAEPPVLAQRQVCIEGLALLRLAEARALATEREYKYCPSLARQAMVEPFSDYDE